MASDPFVPAETATQLGAKMVNMPELLKESDFVTLHSPLIPETMNLIGAAELELMKPTAFLVNCARGPLIDEGALYEALKNNRIGGAGLDVLVDAHPAPDHPLLGLENAIITPHVAFFSGRRPCWNWRNAQRAR